MSPLEILGVAVLIVPAALFLVLGVLTFMYAILEDAWQYSRKEFWAILAISVWMALGFGLIVLGGSA